MNNLKNKFNNRRPIVAMSYKNYLNDPKQVAKLVEDISLALMNDQTVDYFLFPSMGTLETVANICKSSPLDFGAQNIAPAINGAFTGEYSIESLLAIGGKYVELGHYERRTMFNESNDLIKEKLNLTLSKSLIPVLCIGEEKISDEFELTEIFEKQLRQILADSPYDISSVILAYEPAWAIGKDKTASPEYIHRSHGIIRNLCQKLFSDDVAKKIRIIYGGSVAASNTSEIVNHPDVDGVFIGRFGHRLENFLEIARQVKDIKVEDE